MKSLASPVFRFFAILAILFLSASGAAAQANRATITGTVTDPSKAVIAGADITARNVDTGVENTTVSNGDGIYVIPNLAPGTYALTFRKDGFKEVTQPSITLISTQVAEINIAMQIGAASENVTVTAEAPILDNESTAIGTNMNGKVVTDLPLSIYGGGRFVEDFAVALTPGYSPISSPYGAVVNGGQWFTKEYTVDGTTATASIRGDSMETGPSMESVEELQAQTSGLDSATAITSGGVMSFTLKSGTNQFHGSLFGYGHNEFLDANTWTNDNLGLAKTKARAWDYGASIGGPVFKNKTFFFGTFERYTQTDFTLGGPSAFVPTADMLSGNFGALLDKSTVLGTDGAGNTIYKGAIFDPSTGNVFPGNVIPTSAFSAVSQKIIAIYEKSYAPELSGLNSNNRLPKSNSPDQTPNQAVVKIDQNLTAKDRLSGSWIYNNRPRTLVDSGGIWANGTADGGPLSNGRIQIVKSDGFRISESHSFTPSVLNVFNVTYNWYWNGSTSASTGTDWNSTLGFGSTGADNFPKISYGGGINGYGVTGIGNTWQGYSTGATLITGDTLTWAKGRHSFSFGGDFRAYQINSHAGNGALSFNFVPNTTDGGFTNQAGFGFASFLLGDVATANQTTPFDLYGRRKTMTLFAQDSYKVNPKLTLTAGLRWQYAWRYHEKYGHWANFDLSKIDPTYGYPGTLEFANGGGDSFEKDEYWNGFGPQIGFAYAPANKWVLRGSFSLALLPTPGPYFDGVPNAFAPGFQGINSVKAPFNWDSGYPGVFQPGDKNVDPSSLFPLVSVDPHALMPAYTDTFNIGVQYELTPTLRVEVAYIGNRGHHLPDTALAFNQPSGASFLKTLNANPGINPYSNYIFCSNAGDPVTTDLNGSPLNGITCPFANFYGPALATIAPMPQVANWAASYWYYYNLNYVGLPIGQTSYNSMVIDLVKRGGRGWNTDLNYTYSRTRGDTFSAQQEFNGYYTPVQDFANLSQAANSLTSYDQTHVIKGFVTYELPFGKGKHWLSDKGSFINGLVGGWSVNALVLYASGQPFQASINNPYYPLYGNFYPNFNANGVFGPFDPRGYQAGGAPFYYFKSTVASSPIPVDTTVGQVNLGAGPPNIGALRCPGIANEDASLLKYLSFGADGRYQLSMRVEFYNLFNRHSYTINGCGYGSQVDAGNFAQVIGVNDSPRTGQFGVRFTF
jgi:Carboxypeptidase regulatory-like domain/TonB dependent receptor